MKLLAVAAPQFRNFLQFAIWSGLRTSELVAEHTFKARKAIFHDPRTKGNDWHPVIFAIAMKTP
ncbi:hypothetical protein [Paraburkholderia sp. SIMBA_030]|uniref:hypothetical protein n=1 Tax=Paraburkholderia sp. SIMBA_030 TaxID=3085773 RepID=UPI00397ACEC9